MKLLSPIKIGSLELSNRIALAPMTRSKAGTERMANSLMAEYYKQRSSAGLLISEATVISKDGIGWQQSPAIWSSEHAESWKCVTEAVHEAGSLIFLQLWHCGRASHSSFPERNGALPAAPSQVKLNEDYIHTPAGKMPYETPRALTVDEIRTTIDDYARASQFAKDAGFDGIEIHSANGYLLDQFLQSKTNKREDEYGGDTQGRVTLLKEVVSACISVWPAERVGVRLSPNGSFNDMGSPDFREQFLYTAEMLNNFSLGYLHIMDGLAFGFHELGEPMTLSEFRKVFDGVIMGNCGYTKEKAEEAVGSGSADMISFGRPFITNPDLPARFKNNWPLADDADPSLWYNFDSKGYVDYPAYKDE